MVGNYGIDGYSFSTSEKYVAMTYGRTGIRKMALCRALLFLAGSYELTFLCRLVFLCMYPWKIFHDTFSAPFRRLLFSSFARGHLLARKRCSKMQIVELVQVPLQLLQLIEDN